MTSSTETDYHTFIKIENLNYKGFELYYKKPVDVNLRKATIFNNDYNYYYHCGDEPLKLLGYFKGMSKVNLGCPFTDIDYDVYEFDKDKIFCTKKEFIYCSEIPYSKYDIDNNNEFFIVEEMLYLNLYPIYYKKI
jgi:hypothetical protein